MEFIFWRNRWIFTRKTIVMESLNCLSKLFQEPGRLFQGEGNSAAGLKILKVIGSRRYQMIWSPRNCTWTTDGLSGPGIPMPATLGLKRQGKIAEIGRAHV